MSKTASNCHILGYDHLTLWVGNAKQAATYYCVHLGFKPYAYRGLETGSQRVVSHVVRQNDILLEFQSPLNPDNNSMAEHLVRHGDGVKDISFTVDDIEAVVEGVRSKGAIVVKEIHDVGDESTGTVRLATIKAFGDTTHTFVQRLHFKGLFLPEYKESPLNMTFLSTQPKVDLRFHDHVVGIIAMEVTLDSMMDLYEAGMGLKQFWAFDENHLHSEHTSVRARVMTNDDESVKFLVSQPAPEDQMLKTFLKYYDGPGVHHFAFNSDNIIEDVKAMSARGMEFMKTPDAYYKQLRERLKTSSVKVAEDLDVLQALSILCDFDDKGYLLQTFTKPLQDRPTHVIEIIQRRNHQGFGVNNIKALFEIHEADQKALLKGM